MTKVAIRSESGREVSDICTLNQNSAKNCFLSEALYAGDSKVTQSGAGAGCETDIFMQPETLMLEAHRRIGA